MVSARKDEESGDVDHGAHDSIPHKNAIDEVI